MTIDRPTIETFLRFGQQLDSLLLLLMAGAALPFLVGVRRLRLTPQRAFRVSPLLGAGLFAIVGVARLPLMMQSPWYDETFTARFVDMPWSGFLTALMGDVHPPGYYLLARLVHTVLAPTTLEFSARLPSWLAGMFVPMLIIMIAKKLTRDSNVSFAAGVIAALLPATWYYSTEARYPMLLTCAVLLSIHAYLDDRPRLFTAATGAILWFHNLGAVYVALLLGAALLKRQRRWTLAAAGAAALAGLWIPGLLVQAADVADGFWLQDTRVPFWHMISMSVRQGTILPALLPVQWGAPLMLSLFGGWTSRSWIRQRPIWTLVAIGAPIALWAAQVWSPVYLARALLAPALLMTIPWAWFLLRTSSRWRYILAAALAVGMVSGNLRQLARDRSDVDEVFDLCAGADVLYTTSTNMAVMALSYSAIPAYTWSEGNNLHQVLSDDARLAMQIAMRPLARLAGQEVCMVSQISYYTTDEEMSFVETVKRDHQPTIREITESDLFHYVVMRFTP
ncbi:MAG: glycosyltransferase family 39 protein [Anaerolineae bacterium]|nr:glycosyltransferase family 39 protein [Anaerolineae bacterium]NUQ03824.1 hypothetical protein [Anaerolineae bacterium]